jgi:hypothetical protein
VHARQVHPLVHPQRLTLLPPCAPGCSRGACRPPSAAAAARRRPDAAAGGLGSPLCVQAAPAPHTPLQPAPLADQTRSDHAHLEWATCAGARAASARGPPASACRRRCRSLHPQACALAISRRCSATFISVHLRRMSISVRCWCHNPLPCQFVAVRRCSVSQPLQHRLLRG